MVFMQNLKSVVLIVVGGKFLGYVISSEGISMDPIKVQTMLE